MPGSARSPAPPPNPADTIPRPVSFQDILRSTMAAGRRGSARSARTPVLVDVTPRALVVETVGGWCDVVVQRNAKIPCERTRAFTTSSDMQTVVRVRVAQGEDPVFEKNTFLGQVELVGPARRPARRGDHPRALRGRRERHAQGLRDRRAARAARRTRSCSSSASRRPAPSTRCARATPPVGYNEGRSRAMSSNPARPLEPLAAWLDVLDELTYYELFGLDSRAGRRRRPRGVPRLLRHVPPRPTPRPRRPTSATPSRRSSSAAPRRTWSSRRGPPRSVRRAARRRARGRLPAAHPLLAARPARAQRRARGGDARGRGASPSARPFARRAEELIRAGDLRQAKLQLVMADHFDPENAVLVGCAQGARGAAERLTGVS